MKRFVSMAVVALLASVVLVAQQANPGVNFHRLIDGSVANLSRAYINDGDTGSYRIGANNEGFVAGGVLRWDYNTTRLLSTLPIQAPSGTCVDLTVPYSYAADTDTGFDRFASGQVGVCSNGSLSAVIGGADPYRFSIGNDATLIRDAANVIGQREGTSAQRQNIYNTWTSAANNEAFSVDWQTTANVARAGTRTAATGTTRPLYLVAQAANASANYAELRITHAAAFLFNMMGAAAQVAATQTTAPTCSSNCGTSPSVVGSDTAMIVTMGSSGVPASPFTVTFNGTWAAAPSCTVTSALGTMVVGKIAIAAPTTTTTVIITTNGTAPATSDKYAIHCLGVQ